MKLHSLAVAVAIASAIGLAAADGAHAKLTRAELERLGGDLTPLGAEKAGNKEGTIPAWDGGLTTPPAGWSPGQPYADPFAAEKPLFTITAANAEQYKAHLSAGQVELLKRYPNFKMAVYSSHRTAGYAAPLLGQVRAQAETADLQNGAVTNVTSGYFPFPIPKSGVEAVWNHLLRYAGGGVEDHADTFMVRASGDYSKFGLRLKRIYASNLDSPKPGELNRYLSYYTSPASLEGTVYLVHDPIDQVNNSRAAWIYNAGQRRVRRAPDLAYDMITDGSEGMYVVDQVDAYNGAPDRYDWALVGKKEVFVAYNTYKSTDKSLKYSDILQKNTVNPDTVRYELHRVWVVEGTLKQDKQHLYGKRVFYLDEDSWTLLLEDAYDTRGGLWRVGIHGLMQFYDAGVPLYAFNLWHDLTSGGYCIYGINNESKTVRKLGVTGKANDFEPDALRRLGTK